MHNEKKRTNIFLRLKSSVYTTSSWNRVELNCNGYDPFIDFIKGVCILLVVLTHCLPDHIRAYTLFPLWGNPAVPIFLLIQVFHTYKKGVDMANVNFKKIWKRIVKPFILTELLIISIVCIQIVSKKNIVWNDFITSTLMQGGYGPGSYYPWIYVQFAIILPLITHIFKYIKGIWLAITFIIISEFIEILCSIIGIPEWFYRLSFLRYTFLIYLGYLLTNGYSLNIKTVVLSVISIVSVLFFSYYDISLSPFIFDTGWKTCHWICYFYIAFLIIPLIKRQYIRTCIYIPCVKDYIEKMGRYSYEIFLFQMVYFQLISPSIVKRVNSFTDGFAAQTLSILLAVTICISPIVIYKDWRQSIKNKNTHHVISGKKYK